MWFSKLISGEEQPEVPELVTAYDRLDKLKEVSVQVIVTNYYHYHYHHHHHLVMNTGFQFCLLSLTHTNNTFNILFIQLPTRLLIQNK